MACRHSGGDDSNEPARSWGAESPHPKRRCVVRFSDELLDDWQRAALSNDERVEILMTICEGRTTPKRIADALGKPLRRVKYHVGVLHNRDLIEEDPLGQRTAAEDRLYRAVVSAHA